MTPVQQGVLGLLAASGIYDCEPSPDVLRAQREFAFTGDRSQLYKFCSSCVAFIRYSPTHVDRKVQTAYGSAVKKEAG